MLSHKNQVSVPTLLFAKNIKAEMTIFIAQPLFLESGSTLSEMRDFFRIDVSSKSFKPVLFELKLQV